MGRSHAGPRALQKRFAKTTRIVPVTLSAAHPPDPAGLVENTPPHPQRIVRPVPFLQVGFLDVQSTVTGRGKSEEPAASLHTVHPAPPPPIRTPIIRSAHRTYASTSHTTRWGTGYSGRIVIAGTIPGDLERRSVSLRVLPSSVQVPNFECTTLPLAPTAPLASSAQTVA